MARELYCILFRGVLAIISGSLLCKYMTLVSALGNLETNLSSGRISGQRIKLDFSIGGDILTDTVDQWLGVPYGKADRWQVPSFPDPWTGVRNCSRDGPVCPQQPLYVKTQEDLQHEDCLVLNIYSPVEFGARNKLYPVMVYIHGGSYMVGSGNRYDGKQLATHGVVVVTVNYRLGILGYMTTGDDMIRGNYGLQDQILAVKWISLNIERFRGNSSCITLFGNSAGASSVGILMTTPQTEGIFHRAIIQSGSPLSFWSVHDPGMKLQEIIRAAALSAHCDHDHLQREIDCLKSLGYEELISMHLDLKRPNPSNLLFKPSVDGLVVPNLPVESFEKGKYHHVDVMIGVVTNEWAPNAGWFTKDVQDIQRNDGLTRDSLIIAVNHVIQNRFGWPAYLADLVMQLYTNTSYVYDNDANRQSYVDMMNDLTMFSPSIKLASILSSHQSSVYFYEFDHHSKHTYPRWWGSYHALELDFVFGSPFSGYSIALDGSILWGEEDKNLSKKMMKLWTDFAKYGNPQGPPETNQSVCVPGGTGCTVHTDQVTTKDPSKWKTYDNKDQFYLYISSKGFILKQHFRETEIFFWNKLVPRLLRSQWKPNNQTDLYYWVIIAVVTALLCIVLILVLILLFKYWALSKKMAALKKLLRSNEHI